MIYTVTFNPSLDYVVRVNEFELGALHRTQAEDLIVGGKGINVSAVLKELGVESIALGFVAGFTGNEIIHRLSRMGISSDFIALSQGISRINVKLKSDRIMETEINGQGPAPDQGELEQLYAKLHRLQPGDFLILSGSLSKCIPESEHIYADICKIAQTLKIKLVVDAEGDLLRNTLCEKPFLIKPNKQELEKLFSRTLADQAEYYECAKQLQMEGALNVLISLGEEGALLLDEYGVLHRQAALQGEVLNSAGAGDSLIAGFLSMLCSISKKGRPYQSDDYRKALRLGVAAGSAGAFSIALPDKAKIDMVLNQMN